MLNLKIAKEESKDDMATGNRLNYWSKKISEMKPCVSAFIEGLIANANIYGNCIVSMSSTTRAPQKFLPVTSSLIQ